MCNEELILQAKKIVDDSPLMSAIDIGEEIVFFFGYEDEYTGDIGLAINKETKTHRNFFVSENENWKLLDSGIEVNVKEGA